MEELEYLFIDEVLVEESLEHKLLNLKDHAKNIYIINARREKPKKYYELMQEIEIIEALIEKQNLDKSFIIQNQKQNPKPKRRL